MKHGHIPEDLSRRAGRIARTLTDSGTRIVLICANWREIEFAEAASDLEEEHEVLSEARRELDDLARALYALLNEKEKAGVVAPARVEAQGKQATQPEGGTPRRPARSSR